MDFITIAEAVSISGKSISTVRRLVRRLFNEDSHDLVKKENGPQGERFLIRRDVLIKELGEVNHEIPPPEVHEDYPKSNLERVIEVLQEQVHEQQKTITQLLERQRETNILMNN